MAAHARSERRRTALGWGSKVGALALLLVVWGCSTPPGAGVEDAWTALAPGGEVEGPEGVRLVAPEGVLDEAVDVELARVDLPELPLEDDLEPVGDAVQVVARTRAATVSGDAFVLEVPVPPGTDADTAGVAVYLAGGEVGYHDDAGTPLDAPFWDVVELETDEGGTVARVDLSVLSDAPMIVQVVNGADFMEFDLPAVQAHGNGFVVVCRRKHVDVCNDHGADAIAAFAAAHASFAGMGFFEPFLRTTWGGAYKVNLRPYIVESGSGTCKVDTDLDGRTGRYVLPLKKVVVCVGGGPFPGVTEDTGWTDRSSRTAAHELFHAVQYAHLSIRARPMQMWSMEGTANLSEVSTATELIRDASTPRAVDVPLDLNFIANPGASDSNQYRTQDFFAFLGDVIAPGQGLGYLFDIFLEGPTPPAVSRGIEGYGHPELGDLSEAYWAWARNQTFEKTVQSATRTNTPGTTTLHPRGAACDLLAAVATPYKILMLDGTSPASYSETLPPLTSKVLEIVVDAPGPLDVEMVYQTHLDGSGLRAALYDPADCRNPDIPALGLFQVPAGTTGTRYLLVSNTEFRQGRTRDFTFEIDYGQVEPGVRIVEPQEGITIGEDETFTLRAEGVDGVLPGDAVLLWTYTRNGGVPFTLAMEDAEVPVPMPTVCDGEYVIAVEVFDGPDAFEGATDQVTVTVEDAIPRPAKCAWSVDITQPSPNAKVGVGEPATFRAFFDDDHPETEAPLDTITWYRKDHFGGIFWNEFGTGVETTASFSEGFWDIRVTYGDAEDAILIQADAGSPPTASIVSPEPDTTYHWSDYPELDVVIPLEADVDDAEDGPLTGSDVVWETRSNVFPDWSPHATGTSATYTSRFQFEWVEFRVVATDSDGFEGVSETVRVRFVQPPS